MSKLKRTFEEIKPRDELRTRVLENAKAEKIIEVKPKRARKLKFTLRMAAASALSFILLCCIAVGALSAPSGSDRMRGFSSAAQIERYVRDAYNNRGGDSFFGIRGGFGRDLVNDIPAMEDAGTGNSFG